jgi:hypothetical protein
MPFNIDTYKRRSAPVALDGVNFSEFARQPLDAATLRCISYMHDIEHHTICYLRDLLVTPHRDHEMTTFLTMWALEEYWHGEALGSVLAAHGEASGGDRVGPMRMRLREGELVSALLRPRLRDRRPLVRRDPHDVGCHQRVDRAAAYGRLAQQRPSDALAPLEAHPASEGGHIDFYASQATKRLDGDSMVQRATRFALRRFWTPVGSDVMPDEEVWFVNNHLFGGEDGRAAVCQAHRPSHRSSCTGPPACISPRGRARRLAAAGSCTTPRCSSVLDRSR